MEVQQVLEEKYELEKTIKNLIKEFQNKSGVDIISIDINQTQTMQDMVIQGIRITLAFPK